MNFVTDVKQLISDVVILWTHSIVLTKKDYSKKIVVVVWLLLYFTTEKYKQILIFLD